jgi:hypothetical protein
VFSHIAYIPGILILHGKDSPKSFAQMFCRIKPPVCLLLALFFPHAATFLSSDNEEKDSNNFFALEETDSMRPTKFIDPTTSHQPLEIAALRVDLCNPTCS